jgi:hypothetical protein
MRIVKMIEILRVSGFFPIFLVSNLAHEKRGPKLKEKQKNYYD